MAIRLRVSTFSLSSSIDFRIRQNYISEEKKLVIKQYIERKIDQDPGSFWLWSRHLNKGRVKWLSLQF